MADFLARRAWRGCPGRRQTRPKGMAWRAGPEVVGLREPAGTTQVFRRMCFCFNTPRVFQFQCRAMRRRGDSFIFRGTGMQGTPPLGPLDVWSDRSIEATAALQSLSSKDRDDGSNKP
jgi:hypothetical protein